MPAVPNRQAPMLDTHAVAVGQVAVLVVTGKPGERFAHIISPHPSGFPMLSERAGDFQRLLEALVATEEKDE